ncbi:Sodium/calcium exchanger protein-domain-containing protein [Pelagophyceae sp. CCMP2097]|nr:Sodium/calcium exchanger protein-domain-containing protein [Pelagophyceae sp. CCMP2097]
MDLDRHLRRWRKKLLYVAQTEAHVRPFQDEGAQSYGLYKGTKTLLLGSKLNLLLCFVWAVPFTASSPGARFAVASFVLLPLAALLGDVTEKLAYHTNETVGGLLNATFGNATEVIVSVCALRRGLVRVVQVSLLGSVLSNMLLVLGCAFIAAGLRQKVSKFNKLAATANTNLLFVAVMALSIPSLLSLTTKITQREEETFSRLTSAIMLFCYSCYIYFQLGSHSHLFDEAASDGDEAKEPDDDEGARFSGSPVPGPRMADVVLQAIRQRDLRDAPPTFDHGSEEDDEDFVFDFWAAIALLTALTAGIALLSEVITGALQGAASAWDLPDAFIGFVLLPIVGNAAEHATAISMARRGKIDLAIAVALGSSTQIALLCIPLMTLFAWPMRQPLTLVFGNFEASILLLAVLLVAAQVTASESHWLNGVLLVAAYVIIADAFVYL